MEREFAFEMAASTVRFGPGVTAEVGMDAADMGLKRVAVFTDERVAKLTPVAIVRDALHNQGIDYVLYEHVRIEPNDMSMLHAISFARHEHFDGFIAVGGGSTIDTAKVANLYSTYPVDDFLDYVNPPIGKGKSPPGPLRPLLAIPTTAGTGSETTGVAIFDYSPMHAKTGIASPRLKPTLGYLDPENTRTAPPQVAASAGLDVLSHAIESYTAMSYRDRSRPARPSARPAYQGANPISDVWALQSLRLVAHYLRRAVADPADNEARAAMILAASYAGMGFGNAGVHLPHGMSYPVSGMVRNYLPDGYDSPRPLAPHGISVILNAPAVFRYTAQANPQRHLDVATILGADTAHANPADAGKILSAELVRIMEDLRCPNGLQELGYTTADIPNLVEGTLPQHRVTKLSPRPAGREELARLFEESMQAW